MLAWPQQADMSVLATKPQQMAAALAGLGRKRARQAGDLDCRGRQAGDAWRPRCAKSRLVRVMPNTPCLVGQSASGYCLGPGATAADGQLVGRTARRGGPRVCGRRKTAGRRDRACRARVRRLST